MTDAAPISQSERNLRHLLADPGAQAAWYAEKRIDFLDYKVERARERLAALEAELAQAKDEWRAIQAGEAEAPQSDQCLARYAKDQCKDHRAENESELVAECNLVDAALDLTGLSSRGWLISKTKADDWCEYIILARARSQSRRRNNQKAVLESLLVGVSTFNEARKSGAAPDSCAQAARAAYDAKLGDLGSLGAIENTPELFALEAYRTTRVEGKFQARLPRRMWQPQALEVFHVALVNETARATAPPT